jgi:hypothetical protein
VATTKAADTAKLITIFFIRLPPKILHYCCPKMP